MQIGHVKEAEQAFARSIKLRGDKDSAVSMRMVCPSAPPYRAYILLHLCHPLMLAGRLYSGDAALQYALGATVQQLQQSPRQVAELRRGCGDHMAAITMLDRALATAPPRHHIELLFLRGAPVRLFACRQEKQWRSC